MNFKRKIKNVIGKCIEYIERYELRNLDLDENDINKKILDSQELTNVEILTDTGFSEVSEIHKTQPYTVYEIILEDGKKLECADNHIVYRERLEIINNIKTATFEEVFAKDLNIGDYVITTTGLSRLVSLTRLPYKICMYDVSLNDLNHRFYTNDILSHNTTTTVAFIAWYLCFHTDRNIAVLANKQDTAIEIMSKLTDVFKGLPFYMKPGIKSQGMKGMKLENGCMIMSAATTKSASIGFTIHILYLDEAAHVPDNIMGDLWRSIYPTLSSSEISQCILSSTPNGTKNKYYEIWDQAINKAEGDTDAFYPIRVDWWEVPGHDEAWANGMRKKFGETEFEQEFALSFNVSARSLLSSEIKKILSRIKRKYMWYDFTNTFTIEPDYYKNLCWHPTFDVAGVVKNDPSRKFILSIDTGEGKDDDDDEGKNPDYNVINIFEVKLKSKSKIRKIMPSQRKLENMYRLEQIGIYRDNSNDEAISAEICKELVFNLFGEESTKINIEMNFNGKNFVTIFKDHEDYYEEIFIKTHHNKPIPGEKSKKKIGYKTNANKEFYCKEGKKHLERENKIILTEEKTIDEILQFGKDAKGKYKGLGVKDDTTITVLMLSRVFEQEEYTVLVNELFENTTGDLAEYVASLLNMYIDPSDSTISSELYKQDTYDEYNIMESIQKASVYSSQQTNYKYKPHIS